MMHEGSSRSSTKILPYLPCLLRPFPCWSAYPVYIPCLYASPDDAHLQGFHSTDSEDQQSDDEEDHVEGMSGDEQMGEQQDFDGSDSFDEVGHSCCCKT